MHEFGVFSRTSIFNSHHNSKIRKNTAQATTARRTYECTSARSHASPSRRAPSRVQTCVQHMQAHAIMLSSKRSCPNRPQVWDGAQGVARAADRGAGAARCTPCREKPRGLRGRQRGVRGVVRQKWGQLTWLKLFSLLQHLGLVGATGPHSGSRGEHRSPRWCTRASIGEQARRQAHTVHDTVSCDRFDRAAAALTAYPFPQPPRTHTFSESHRCRGIGSRRLELLERTVSVTEE